MASQKQMTELMRDHCAQESRSVRPELAMSVFDTIEEDVTILACATLIEECQPENHVR
jgi:hypothetical protein